MLTSLSRSTLIRSGLALLVLTAFVWALRQDVHGPRFLRAELTPSDVAAWTGVTDMKCGTDPIYGVRYGNGRFVAVGYGGKAVTSTDGANWTTIDDIKFGSTAINAIENGNNIFVALGDNGKGSYSTNGISWVAIGDTKFGSTNIRSVAFGAGKYIAVGLGGKGAYSTDAVTWTAVADMKFGTSAVNGVAYGAGTYVAVGAGGKGAYSADGITWTAVPDMTFGSATISSVAYGNGKFIAVGYGGKGAYSTNGITWTAIDNTMMDADLNFYSIAYGNGLFVAAGANGSASVDGITWTAVSDMKFGMTAINSVAYGNGKFVAVGQLGKGSYSGTQAASSSSEDCWPLGWIDAGGKPCCAGTRSILTQEELTVPGLGISCRQVVAGNTCAPCGNGVCDSQYENRCNCPGDCGQLPTGSSSSAAGTAVCGNGIKETGEDCKEPGTGTCTSPQQCIQCKCQLTQQMHCGNMTGVTGSCNHVGQSCVILCQSNDHVLAGLCDNQNNCFGYCGDNKVDAPVEQCDRGDPSSDPACNEFCQVRSGWTCTGSPSVCTQNPVSSSSSSSTAVSNGLLTSIIVTPKLEGTLFVYDVLATIKNVGSSTASSIALQLTVPNTLQVRTSATDAKCTQAYTPGNTIIFGCVYTNSSSIVIPLEPGQSKTFHLTFTTSPKPSAFVIQAESKKFVGDGVVGSKAQWNWTCGNSTIDSGEQCDGAATTCSGQSCTDLCQCASVCANGILESGEQCESRARHYSLAAGSVPYVTLGAGDMTIGDVTADGNLDIVTANNTTPDTDAPKRITVLPGNGDGTFANSINTDIVALQASLGLSNIRIGEFNGDGKADVLLLENQTRVGYEDSQKVRLARGNGDGTFHTLEAILPDDPSVMKMEIGDFNGDGNPDVLAVMNAPTSVPAAVRLFTSQADHTYRMGPDIVTTTLAFLKTGDFDGDGKLDFIVPATGKMNILFGKGDGTFDATSVVISNPSPVTVGAVNADNRTDFVTPSGAYIAKADRTFESVLLTGVPSYTGLIQLADMNGDGRQDLLYCTTAMCWYSVNVMFGKGNGAFQFASGNIGDSMIQMSSNTVYSTLPADFNRDGRDDLAILENRNGSGQDAGIGVYITSCSTSQLCSNTCQCAAAVMAPVSSSSSSSVAPVAACGDGTLNAGETCDYGDDNTCPGAQMCSSTCTCVACSATGTPVEFESELNRSNDISFIPDVVKLDPTHALLVYYSRSSGAKARVATIDGGTITLGTPVTFTSETFPNDADSPVIASVVDSRHVIIAFPSYYKRCKGVLATVNGDTVSFSSPALLFNRTGYCLISTDGNTIHRRYDSRVIETGVATITGDQISWKFTEEDQGGAALSSFADRVSLGNGKDLRLMSWSVIVQGWPSFSKLWAFGVGGNYAVALCNQNDDYCNCYTSGAQNCVEVTAFDGGKIIPIGGNQFRIFTHGNIMGGWKVTPLTLNGTKLTLGTPVDMASFSFGSAAATNSAIQSGRFFVDIRPGTYGIQSDSGFTRLDVGPTGSITEHTSSAGAFLNTTSYIRAYKEGGSYPRGLAQVINSCTASPVSSSSSSSSSSSRSSSSAGSIQDTLSSSSSSSSKSSSSSLGITVTSSSSVSSSKSSSSSAAVSSSSQTSYVCGNGQKEGSEACELGVCCASGYSCDTRTCTCTLLSVVPTQSATCGNFRIEAGEDCEDGISLPQSPCTGTTVCDVSTCRCPTGTARCPRWRSSP